jgi:NADH:ubiquinone oxidoreductase subunit 2 (subunit N)
MLELLERRETIDCIVIETSGLALPKPLVQAFRWPEIRHGATVDGVVTVVDCEALAKGHLVGDLAGMFYRRPAASIGLTVSLISLIGLPLTAGFWAKFMVFVGVVSDRRVDSISLVMGVLMAFNAVIAAGYYWRVLSTLYSKSASNVPLRVFRPSLFVAYTICTVLTILWFFVPASM